MSHWWELVLGWFVLYCVALQLGRWRSTDWKKLRDFILTNHLRLTLSPWVSSGYFHNLFCWDLGLTEGLVEEGLQEFFIKHVTDSMWNSGQLLTGCILSFGNFFSIACVQLVRSWFEGPTINDSHLDRYFRTLAILSAVFLCFFMRTLQYLTPSMPT